MQRYGIFTSILLFTACSILYSVDVTSDTELEAAIEAANAGGDATINFQNQIILTGSIGPNLRPVKGVLHNL